MSDCKHEDIRQSAEELRKAADAFLGRLLGSEAHGHLRQAARHALKAARHAIEEAEKRLDEQPAPKN